MLGGGVIKIISSCLIDYFGPSSTLFENFDWTNTVSFFSWSFLPWWPKSMKSHDLVFENKITGARTNFVHANFPNPVSVWGNRICFKEWNLFLTMPPPKKYFWALRRAVPYDPYNLLSAKKNGKCRNFFHVGIPPVGEPHVCEKKIMVYFAF